MALAVDLSSVTAADGTFSVAGAAAWLTVKDRTATLTGIASAAQGGTGLATIAALSTWVANALDTPLVITPGAGQSIRINAGNTAWEAYTPAAAGASLNGITAATGAVTIASGNNTGIVWNWANTTDSTRAFQLGETTAATNGTSTSNIPNQVLFKLITAASSTQSPFQVYERGVHVMSVSPSTAQLIMNGGTIAAPVVTSVNDLTTGLVFGNQSFTLSVGGVGGLLFAGTALQLSQGAANTASYVFNWRKARGTVAAPTVITTGDDLGTMNFSGYVGATNTYQAAAQIVVDSTGTISDSTTGIGGIIRFLHAIVGSEPAEVAKFDAQHLIHEGTSPTITAGGGTNPTIVGKDEAFEVTVGTGGIATSVEVTFGHAFITNPPVCVAASDTDIVPFKCVVTTTKVTISATLAFTAGSILHVICRGWE